jgi:hypothetical protein
MKLTKLQLKQIIKEEIEKIDLEEIDLPFSSQAKMQSAVNKLEWPELRKQILLDLAEIAKGWIESHDKGEINLSPWNYARLEKQAYGGPRGQLVLPLDDPRAEQKADYTGHPDAESARKAWHKDQVADAHRVLKSPGSGYEQQVAEDLQKLVKEELVNILKNK